VSEFVDAHYVTLLSGRLDKFKRKKENLYNFRCPYCGDSQKHKSKARGYFFRVKADMVYKCHNCGVGRTLSNFLKDQAPDLHDEYIMERYKKGTTGKGSYVPKPKFDKPVFKKTGNLESISDLNKEHDAVKYLRDRKIPEKYFGELFYTRRFYTWTNTQKPSFERVDKDQPRIIIPFIDEASEEWFGYQGRSLDPRDQLRYITIMLDENRPKIYGLNRLDKRKPIYVVEGPFDSLFLDNSIAMAGSDVDSRTFGWSNYIWVYDNEPRNREIVNRISSTIDRDEQVVIWPNDIQQKDINDMVLAGHNVQKVVESNTYSGLEAQIKLTEWKKV
tara:strand:+ start:128 stop:1120 length:993 start_codon:yes stop_codon:yes gene_type:complete